MSDATWHDMDELHAALTDAGAPTMGYANRYLSVLERIEWLGKTVRTLSAQREQHLSTCTAYHRTGRCPHREP